MRDEIEQRADSYGLDDLVVSYTGATISRKTPPYAFVNVVETTEADPDVALRTVLFATGVGTLSEGEPVQAAGVEVRTGTVEADVGTVDYALWQPAPNLTVSVAVSLSGKRLNINAVAAMEEIVAFAHDNNGQ